MDNMELIAALNRYVIWGPPMVLLMLGTGLFLTLVTKGVLFTRFSTVMKCTLSTLLRKQDRSRNPEGAITPFQAVCTALAATVGTGNIVGVALSIATGGPGAVFWLWISALVGMVIKYAEVTLSVAYRTVNGSGEIVGGPMYYISKGMGSRGLAVVFALLGAIAACGTGASVQANALAGSIHAAFHIPHWVTGLAAAALGGLVLIGGIRRIATVTEILVPFMAAFYILGAVAVCTVNAAEIPGAIGSIFRHAFTGSAASGGFLGASFLQACRTGMARGVFTHEAGMGSAPIAHASAATDHPTRQGLWGAFEVFFDSIVMCTVTALVILTSGVWRASPLLDRNAMSALAFEQAFPGGEAIVCLGLVLFAFATIVAWYYYGEKCMEYLFPGKTALLRGYRIFYVASIYAGCTASLEAVWALADLCNGLMALPNLMALLVLWPVLRRLTQDFFRDPDRIRPRDADFSSFLKS